MKQRYLLLLASIFIVAGCTQQIRVKQLGGTMTETLPAGKKLVNVTWKTEQLWILTRSMTSDDKAETYEFKESSAWGLLQGTVIIKETK